LLLQKFLFFINHSDAVYNAPPQISGTEGGVSRFEEAPHGQHAYLQGIALHAHHEMQEEILFFNQCFGQF
jgi:hypothetical protein